MQNPEAEGCSRNGHNSRRCLLGTSPKWPLKAEVIRRAKLESKAVHFATCMDLCHLRNSELEKKFQNYEGRVELRGWYRDGRFRELRRIHGAMCFGVTQDGGKSFGHDSKITQLFWTSKWCRERMHASQNERCTSIFHLSEEYVSMIWIRLPSARRPKQKGIYWRSSFYRWSAIFTVIHWLDSHGREHFEDILLEKGWKKQKFLDSECWRHKMAGQTQNMQKICATARETDLEDLVSFTDQANLGVLNGQHKSITEQWWKIRNYSRSWSAQAQMSKPKRKILKTSQHGASIWKVTVKKCVERYCEVAHKTIDHALLGRSPNKTTKIWKLMENCQRFAPRVYWNACTWQEMEDQNLPWTVNHLARSVTEPSVRSSTSTSHHATNYK